MQRTTFFKFFAASDQAPSAPLPAQMLGVEVPELKLYVHRDADWVLEKKGSDWVFLTGIAYHLESTLDLNGLAQQLLQSQAPLDEIDLWSGWFSVVHCRQGKVHVYNDAAAGHKVYFRLLSGGGKWCGSDPKLSAHWSPLTAHLDEDMRGLHASKWMANRGTMVGDMTPFHGVRQVVANHRLDWAVLRPERTFPRKPRRPMTSAAAVDYVVPRLENVLAQAVKHRQVNMALTAGWDSRITLALSRKVKSKIRYYTIQHQGVDLEFPDLALPRAMSKEGFVHQILTDSVEEGHPDWRVVRDSLSMANYKRFHSFFCMFPEYQPDQMTIVGTVSEVAKNYLEHIPIRTGLHAVRAAHLVEHPAILDYFDGWMKDSAPRVKASGYRVLDLLHWEQDITNFAGSGAQNTNFVVHQFAPFSSGKILETLLATPTNERDKYIPKMYEQLILAAWPELMNHPVNPFFKEDAIRMMKRTGLYNPYKFLGNRLVSQPFRG